MSDRVNAMEIEDVLSSIRRLVSEDLRPAEGKVSPTSEGAPLLLTPALRVVPAQGAGEGSEGQAEERDEAPAPLEVAPAPVEVAAAPEGGATAEPPENPASDLVAEPIEAVVARLGAQLEDAGFDAELAEPVQPDAAQDSWSIPMSGVSAETVEEALVVDSLSPEAARVLASWQADPGWSPEAETAEAVAAWQAELAGDLAEWPQPSARPQADPDQAAADAMAEIAADEAGFEHQVLEESVMGLFEPAPDAELDEDALREMVRDVIREELQGALGERITRNVRKLVRAEIARAMALRDMT